MRRLEASRSSTYEDDAMQRIKTIGLGIISAYSRKVWRRNPSSKLAWKLRDGSRVYVALPVIPIDARCGSKARMWLSRVAHLKKLRNRLDRFQSQSMSKQHHPIGNTNSLNEPFTLFRDQNAERTLEIENENDPFTLTMFSDQIKNENDVDWGD